MGSAPMNGKTFEARVHKIDNSGNGIIETTGENDIILGPVKQEAVGERIEAMKLPGPFARIKRPRNILPSNYINEFQNQLPYDFSIDYGDAHGNISKAGLRKQELGYGILEYIPPWESKGLISTTIDRRTNSGNGMVSIDNRSVNIGPVRDGVTGADVSVILIGPKMGVCKTLSVREENYFRNHPRKIGDELVDTENHFTLGMRVHDRDTDEPENAVIVNLPPIPAEDYISHYDGETDVSVAEDNPKYDCHASVVVVIFEDTLIEEFPEFSGEEPIPLQTLSKNKIDHYAFPPERLEIITDSISHSEKVSDILDSEADSQPNSSDKIFMSHSGSADGVDDKIPEDVLASEDSSYKYQINSATNSETIDNNSDTPIDTHNPKEDSDNTGASSNSVEDNKESVEDSADLIELREKAEESAMETVPEKLTAKSRTPQYSRSSAIRDYVMARADGICEGCGEPSPFKSKSGEPYLHSHHIHELSDGGSDTPDTVVALCPNCHYRVHHGVSGNKFNRELLTKVQRIEKHMK